MWVRVLGSAAGGGYPQWNCTCLPCRAVRDGSRPCRPRTQSSIAVSPDYRQWFLLNASPDIHAQIESCPALHPSRGSGGEREVPVSAVLLTDAELDHTLGLLLLREGRGLEIHATQATHDVLQTVPASGNMTIGPQQFWLGTSRTGQTVSFWIDTTTVHMSVGGWRIKTVPSRLSAVDVARLRNTGAHPPGRTAADRERARCPGCDQLRGSAAAGQRRRDHHPRQPGHPGRLPAGRAASPGLLT